MSDKQDLGELLREALDDITDAGGQERALLRQTIGKPAYEKLISSHRGADLVDRWINASGKAKAPATKALALQIARVADKPELVKRIEREVSDAFAEPSEVGTHRAPTKSEHKKPDKRRSLADLAKGSDLRKYIEARQNGGH